MVCSKRLRNLGERSAWERRSDTGRRQNKAIFRSMLGWLIPEDTLFTADRFHGNINWRPEQLARQAVIWAWQGTKNVTDAFAVTAEICEDLGMHKVAKNYTTFMDALDRYRGVFGLRLGQRCQRLAQEVGGRFWRDREWVLMGFDGSRVTTPRTVSNEKEFCAPNYGRGMTAKYRKKKSKGMRRRKNEKSKPQPQAPDSILGKATGVGDVGPVLFDQPGKGAAGIGDHLLDGVLPRLGFHFPEGVAGLSADVRQHRQERRVPSRGGLLATSRSSWSDHQGRPPSNGTAPAGAVVSEKHNRPATREAQQEVSLRRAVHGALPLVTTRTQKAQPSAMIVADGWA